jgi:hypothetical protein
MAGGKEMLTAVLNAVKKQPEHKELRLSTFDAYDLFKVQPSDLRELGVECERAEAISNDLFKKNLAELSAWLGVTLVKDRTARNLIPGEGLRRTAGIWANGNDDLDSIVEEIRRLRHPEAR